MDIKDEVGQIISAITGIDSSKITPSSDLRGHLGIDSFAATEILVALEQKYGVRIDPGETLTLKTVQEVIDLIERCRKDLK